jgi:dienelactone hydrolase
VNAGPDPAREARLGDGLQGTALGVGEGRRVGVLVLAGSSGRVDVDRARLLARHGALAVALRWFGGEDQPRGICEVPLETFVTAVDWLETQGMRRIGVVAVSKGAEGALLLACRDPRVRAVVATSPSSVAWANVGPGLDGRAYPYRSSWSWQGSPLPYVPYDESWQPADERIAYRALYERSLQAFPDARAAAAIPVERCEADLLLVVGGDDAVWPSAAFAEELAARRREAGRLVQAVTDPLAGHRPVFPGEAPPEPSTSLAHGGSPEADTRLGRAAWPHVVACLGLEA